jgi:hypothetical protein
MVAGLYAFARALGGRCDVRSRRHIRRNRKRMASRPCACACVSSNGPPVCSGSHNRRHRKREAPRLCVFANAYLGHSSLRSGRHNRRNCIRRVSRLNVCTRVSLSCLPARCCNRSQRNHTQTASRQCANVDGPRGGQDNPTSHHSPRHRTRSSSPFASSSAARLTPPLFNSCGYELPVRSNAPIHRSPPK